MGTTSRVSVVLLDINGILRKAQKEDPASCVALISGAAGAGLRRPHGRPLPALQPRIRSPSQADLLITGTRPSTCFILSGGLQLLASPWTHSSKAAASSRRSQGNPPSSGVCSPRPTEGPRAARPGECGPLPGLNVCHSSLLSSSPDPPHQGPATPVTREGNPHQEPSRGGRQLSGSRPGLVAGPRTVGG